MLMRFAILAVGLAAAAAGLSACGQSKEEAAATAPAAPAAARYVGRSVQMYQGQELISKVDAGEISPAKDGSLEMKAIGTLPLAFISSDPSLEMKAKGSVPMAGYKNAGF